MGRLNPRYRLDELRYIVGDCQPVLLVAQARIADRDYRADVETLGAEFPSLRRVVLRGALAAGSTPI